MKSDEPMRTDYYTTEEIEAFNRKHDRERGWCYELPRIYFRSPDFPVVYGLDWLTYEPK